MNDYFLVPMHECEMSPHWFDGYRGQKVIIFEEFDWRKWSLFLMNTLTDGYVNQVKIHGGFVPAIWFRVIICSNTDPDGWYPKDDPEVMEGFMGRTTRLIRIDEDPANKKRKTWPVLEVMVGYDKSKAPERKKMAG